MPEETVKVFDHVVVRKTPITNGIVVVKLPNSMSTIAIGSPGECDGLVIDSSNQYMFGLDHQIQICRVEWSNKRGATSEKASDLIALEDVKHITSNVEPKFRIDQIVYVKPYNHAKPGLKYPSVGSEYETDVKILSYTTSLFGNNITYKVFSPVSGYLYFKEDQLLSRGERGYYLYRDFKEGVIQADLLPFFCKGERIKIFDGYVYNMDESVTVKLNKVLNKLIK